MPKVLVVATSRKTKGGITSVVKAHETGEQWKKFKERIIFYMQGFYQTEKATTDLLKHSVKLLQNIQIGK